MSLMDHFRKEFIDNVRHLSQEEGLKDGEIAERLGCSRATVNRTRQAYNIPTANLRNRKDKHCICEACEKEYYVQRKERRKKYCNTCLEKIEPSYKEIQ